MNELTTLLFIGCSIGKLGWVRLCSITEPNRGQSNDWSSVWFDWLRLANHDILLNLVPTGSSSPLMFPLLAWASFETKSWDKNNKNPRSKISMRYLSRENRLRFSSLTLAFRKHALLLLFFMLWGWPIDLVCTSPEMPLTRLVTLEGRWWWCDVPCPGPGWRLLSRTS